MVAMLYSTCDFGIVGWRLSSSINLLTFRAVWEPYMRLCITGRPGLPLCLVNVEFDSWLACAVHVASLRFRGLTFAEVWCTTSLVLGRLIGQSEGGRAFAVLAMHVMENHQRC